MCFGLIMARQILHSELGDSDLLIDAIYLGGEQKNMGAEVLSKLLNVGNAGGFRVAKHSKRIIYCVLLK